MMEYRIAEIFDSIEGEGKRSGTPATFIRLFGCNLRCPYCDTLYAQSEENGMYTPMTEEEIMDKINYRFKRVTITGGEPLLNKTIHILVSQLLKNGFEVNIETNGSADINNLLDQLPTGYDRKLLFFTIDYKLLSSCSNDKMLFDNYTCLKPWDVIKFVVGSDADITCMTGFIEKIRSLYTVMPHIYIGTVYHLYDPKKIIALMLREPLLANAYFQTQLHKLIWGEEAKGV